MFVCSAFSITKQEFKNKYKNKIDSIDLFAKTRNEETIEFCTDLVRLLDIKKSFNYIKNESYLSCINSLFHKVVELDDNANELFPKFEDLLKGNCDFGLSAEEFLKSNFVFCLSAEEFNEELKDFVKIEEVELPKRNSPYCHNRGGVKILIDDKQKRDAYVVLTFFVFLYSILKCLFWYTLDKLFKYSSIFGF